MGASIASLSPIETPIARNDPPLPIRSAMRFILKVVGRQVRLHGHGACKKSVEGLYNSAYWFTLVQPDREFPLTTMMWQPYVTQSKTAG